jgi:hypothetical protein
MEDWNERISRPWASRGNRIDQKNSGIMKSYKNAFQQIHKYEIEDTSILNYVPELKKRLHNLKNESKIKGHHDVE